MLSRRNFVDLGLFLAVVVFPVALFSGFCWSRWKSRDIAPPDGLENKMEDHKKRVANEGIGTYPLDGQPYVAPPAVDPKVTALIDSLVDLADEGIGTHSTAWATGFIAVDDEPRFRGGILGSQQPAVNPTMRDLVRLGARALPDLLNHVSDPRKTKLSAGEDSKFLMVWWHSNEYHCRFRAPNKQPGKVNTGGEASGSQKKHTIRVGDLCYVVVGQIVNRHLAVMRYQPTASLVVNSPVATPALAEAVRKDWAEVTMEQHKQSLIMDALGSSTDADPGALRRLYFYYPEAADPIASKLLSRPWYNFLKIHEFVNERLPKENTKEGRKKLVADFIAENGNLMADLIPFWLHHGRGRIERADEILAEMYPGFDFDTLRPIHAAYEGEQTELINALSSVRSDKLDEAVAKLFRSWDFERIDKDFRIWSDDLALACMDRLIGKQLDNDFKKYCQRRIAELELRKRDVHENSRLQLLQERLHRIIDRKERKVLEK